MVQFGFEEPFGQFFHRPLTGRSVRATDEVERLIGASAALPRRRIRADPIHIARPLRPDTESASKPVSPHRICPATRAGANQYREQSQRATMTDSANPIQAGSPHNPESCSQFSAPVLPAPDEAATRARDCGAVRGEVPRRPFRARRFSR